VSEPKVTVIIPTWKPNKEWMNQAIESLKAQTYPNIEICVSELKHNPIESVKWLRDKNLKWLYIEPIIKPPHFLNIYHQINTALAQTDSKYVCLCGDDDEYYPTKIEKEVEIAEKHDAVIVYSDYEFWNEGLTERVGTPEILPEFTIEVPFMRQCNDLSLFRREYAKFDLSFSRYTQWQKFVKISSDLALKGELDRIQHCPNVGFKYRQHEKGMHVIIKRMFSYWWKNDQVEKDKLVMYMDERKAELKEKGIDPDGNTGSGQGVAAA